MIYLLVFLLIIELGLAYLINKYSFLSFTIISIGSFIITSVAYCIFFNIIGDDISLKCMILVISSMGFMMIGENIGKKIYIKNKYNIHTQTNFYYYATKKKMFMVFLGMLLIFCVRFYYLYKFSLKYGNENGVFGVLASARLPYALGEYSSSSLIEILAIYLTLICEIYSYLYLYYFLYNAILKKIILKRLLLPIIGYCIIAINFTGRTQYIQVATMIIWMMIYLYSQLGNKIYYNKQLVKKIILIGTIGVLLLFIYGEISRNSLENSNLAITITAYIASPLYGFDQYKDIGFYDITAGSKGFGYYTLQNIHSFFNKFGFNFEIPKFHHLPFFKYSKGSSNIYTSLIFPYLDYGIAGLFITRTIVGFVVGILERKVIKADLTKWSTIVCVIFIGILYYDAINAYIADQFIGNLLAPITLLKYTIFSAAVIKIFGKCKKKEICVF